MDQRKIKGEETKIKIIDAAQDIIFENGISSLSAKKIADHARISKSNIFHHFSGVEMIIEAVIIKLCRSSEALEVQSDTLESFFKSLGTHMFDPEGEVRKYYKVIFSFYFEKSGSQRVKDLFKDQKNQMIDYIKTQVFKAEKIEITSELAEIIQMDMDGIMSNFVIDGDVEKYSKLWLSKSKMYIKSIKNI